MATVSITTDWGGTGLYSGAFKAKLFQCVCDVKLIEISHTIEPYKIMDAVFALKNAYSCFGEGSIHVVSVASMNLEDGKRNRELICFREDDRYFIGPNNGLWSMLLSSVPYEAYCINGLNSGVDSFAEVESFVEAIRKISVGDDMDTLGEKVPCVQGPKIQAPYVESNGLQGSLLYFDVYGNGITNITKEKFEEVGKGRRFLITVAREGFSTDVISTDYIYQTSGKLLAIFNSLGYLEISLPYFSLQKYLHSENTMGVRVDFFDSQEGDGKNLELI